MVTVVVITRSWLHEGIISFWNAPRDPEVLGTTGRPIFYKVRGPLWPTAEAGDRARPVSAEKHTPPAKRARGKTGCQSTEPGAGGLAQGECFSHRRRYRYLSGVPAELGSAPCSAEELLQLRLSSRRRPKPVDRRVKPRFGHRSEMHSAITVNVP